jgi:hypothetical protein
MTENGPARDVRWLRQTATQSFQLFMGEQAKSA